MAKKPLCLSAETQSVKPSSIRHSVARKSKGHRKVLVQAEENKSDDVKPDSSCTGFTDKSSFLDTTLTFHTLSHRALDKRIVESIKNRYGWTHPTYVQAKVIPLFLQGKNILLRAPTGSGKTLAYVVPVVHKLLETFVSIEQVSVFTSRKIAALVLLPTRELCQQVFEVFCRVCDLCHSIVTVQHTSENLSKMRCESTALPLVLISTPKALRSYISARATAFHVPEHIVLDSLKYLVLDEADSIMELGFQQDIEFFFKTMLPISTHIHRQTLVCSATLTPQVYKRRY